jgi:hypothetical protein
VGTRRFTVTTDSGNAITEYNVSGTGESNNTATLDRVSALAPYPDLQVTGLAVSPATGLRSGSAVTVQWNDTDTGNAPAAAPWIDYPKDVNTRTGETLFGQTAPYRGPDAAGGGSAPNQLGFTLSDRLRGVGTLLFTVTTDVGNAVVEESGAGTGESNNTASVTQDTTPAPYPDLVATAVSGPGYARAGQLVNASWAVRNQGPAALTGQIWFDSVYLSTDQAPGGDIFLGSISFSDSLDVG